MSMHWFTVVGGQIKPSFFMLQSLVSRYINMNTIHEAKILTTTVLSTAGMPKVYNQWSYLQVACHGSDGWDHWMNSVDHKKESNESIQGH